MEPKAKSQKKLNHLLEHFSTIKTEKYRADLATNNQSPKAAYISCQLHN